MSTLNQGSEPEWTGLKERDEIRAGFLLGVSRLPGDSDSDTFHPADQGPAIQLSDLFPFGPQLLWSPLRPSISSCHI